jgi:hypothetical protein
MIGQLYPSNICKYLPPEGRGRDRAGVGGGLAVWEAIVAPPAGNPAEYCLHEGVSLPGVAHVRVWE